jgi:hypothetical protein
VGTIDKSLRHMVSVEEGFGALIAGTAGATPPGVSTQEAFTFHVGPTGLADGYFKHDLPWYAERAAQLDDHFLQLATTATLELVEREVFVPWLGFAMTAQHAMTSRQPSDIPAFVRESLAVMEAPPASAPA